MSAPELIRFQSPAEMARAAAMAWLADIETMRPTGKPYGVALPGGRFARRFFDCTVELARAQGISLAGVHFFWADERCVPPTDEESNFKVAQEGLFGPLQIPPGNIHRLRGELDPAAAVELAIRELNQVMPAGAAGQPVLDLILLGMGEDGHVASLFPNAGPAVTECTTPFLAVDDSPKPPPRRISLSYPTICAAREVWALVSGDSKADALQESLKKDGKTPFSRVIRQKSGRGVRVFCDSTKDFSYFL